MPRLKSSQAFITSTKRVSASRRIPSALGIRREADTRFVDVMNAWLDFNRGIGQIREWLLNGLALVGVQRDQRVGQQMERPHRGILAHRGEAEDRRLDMDVHAARLQGERAFVARLEACELSL